MGFYTHAETFAGRPVREHDAPEYVASPKKYTPRFAIVYRDERTAIDMLEAFADRPEAAWVTGMVFGPWFQTTAEEPAELIAALARSSGSFPALRHLFVGDVTRDECEASWLEQCDYAPVLAAYPRLETLRVRGVDGLAFGDPFRHAGLRRLVIETGGLPEGAVPAICAAELPNLEHLELWLGTPSYGGVADVACLRPLLAGDRLPRLKVLGLRNSEIADDVAHAVVRSPLLERVEELDLSLGNLSDAGAEALLASPAVARLRRLDLHHHYLSDATCDRLRALGVPVDLSDPCEADEEEVDGETIAYRYNAVSE